METTTSKFKWMEDLNKNDLHDAIINLSLEDKNQLVFDVLDSESPSENNMRVAIVAQSNIIVELTHMLRN